MATVAINSSKENQYQGIFAEMRTILKQGKQVWCLVRPKYRLALIAAAIVMAVCSACNTAIPLLLALLVDRVNEYLKHAISRHDVFGFAMWYLSLMAGAYFFREVLNVARRYLVAIACSHIRQDMHVDLVSHLMTVPLS